MIILPEETDPRRVYQTLIEVVTPRPIAWVTTVDRSGRVNLAPFSFFNAVSGHPPVVVFSPALNRDGSKKDTLRNVEETGEFVVNASVASLADAMNRTSTALPYGESEVDLVGLSLVPSLRVKPARLAESPAQLECRVMQIITFGTGALAGNLVIGEVVAMHVNDDMLDVKGHVDPQKLQTIGRMGGDDYCRTSDLFAIPRPG